MESSCRRSRHQRVGQVEFEPQLPNGTARAGDAGIAWVVVVTLLIRTMPSCYMCHHRARARRKPPEYRCDPGGVLSRTSGGSGQRQQPLPGRCGQR